MILEANDIIEKLQAQKDYLQKRFGIVSLMLFGSYAKNEQSTSSDIDLMYELPRNGTMPYMRLVHLEQYLSSLLGIEKVEMVNKNFAEPIIFEQIQKQGIAIF
jgi:predicted nucleotidyltransferase